MTLTTNGKLDPRICSVALDANALDKDGGARDALVDRLLSLMKAGEIKFVQPNTARKQTLHPNTPSAVRGVMTAQIFTLPTELTPDEQTRRREVLIVMRGNSTTNRHDADADIIFDAAKYGGYLITEDRRILDNRAKLEKIIRLPLCIVSLADFLALYDKFRDEEYEREKLMALYRRK